MTTTEQQPALATTKRKFNRLLDSLTASASASTTSLANSLQVSNASSESISLHGSPEQPNKRPRSAGLSPNVNMDRQRNISEGQERIRLLKEQLLTPRREGTVRVVGKTVNTPKVSTTPKAVTPRKAPNFQPYSQDQFLERLKTFADVRKWTTKPDAISEVEWAKRGWSCDIWNTVACKNGCENRVAVKLRPKRKDKDGRDVEMSEDVAFDIDEALVDRYKELIVEGHSNDCLWRKRACQEDIYHIPIASRTKSMAELLDRYRCLRSIASDLPLLEHMTYPDPSIRHIISRLPSSFFTSTPDTPPPTSPTDIVAFAFAIFGWTGVKESRISLAVCNHCFQRLGLWLSTDARLKEMSKKLDVPLETLRLNLLESHREHCPWKNVSVQGNSPDSPIANMAAWQTLEFMLLGNVKHRENAFSTTPRKQQQDTPKKSHHTRNTDSVDIGSDIEYPRGSLDSVDRPTGYNDDEESGGLREKWSKLKAKLKRSASKKSLKSMKSSKSVKSGKSVATKAGDKEKS
ncbi:c3hc zinc finger domain-containing [Pyrenophora seminiperda CCB06]|uniref:C3hc zinc finger domain-containing n=1 Tax=Pyrenophora seminiperda CCB06 TaxID=1302712 RepID=A0A3M7MHA5_9PLEO|nr:c3hc zinc finger domain-containing [Pyrenophora seminiperda CCB06]